MTNIILKQASEIDDDINFYSDLFNRKPFGESLANLILNSGNESLVISVNANRGEGKSYFLKMWRNYLLNEKNTNEKPLNVIYFDSFKNDFIDDPFLPLLSEILNYKKGDENIFSSIKDKSINVLRSIGPLAGKIGARLLLGGDIKGVENELEKALEGDIADFIGKTLDDFTKKEDSIKIFKDSIEQIILEKGQLIFIIDELDRCRPDFALRLLERIKHFFDIKGLYFVLGINKEQITKYIKKIYGDIDGEEYLQKFIDIEAILPKNISEITNDYYKYITKLINTDYQYVFNSDNTIIINNIIDFYCYISKRYKFSLRELEKNINYFVLFCKSFPGKISYDTSIIVIIIIFVKVRNHTLYRLIKEGNNNKQELMNFLDLSTFDEEYKLNITSILEYFYNDEITSELFNNISFHKYRHLKDRKNVLENILTILEAFHI